MLYLPGWTMRFLELLTDPSSGQLSTSRTGLLLMNIVGAAIAIYMAFTAQGLHAAAIITGVAATDAGVYFASTRKDNRDRLEQ